MIFLKRILVMMGLVALGETVLVIVCFSSLCIRGNKLTILWRTWPSSMLWKEVTPLVGGRLFVNLIHRLLLICWMKKGWRELVGNWIYWLNKFWGCVVFWNIYPFVIFLESGTKWLIVWPSGLQSRRICGMWEIGVFFLWRMWGHWKILF